MKKIPDNQIVFFHSKDGNITIEVLYENENIWLSQKEMAELYGTSTQNITMHLKNICENAELQELSTCKEFLQVQNEGKRKVTRAIKLYSLEAILAVGYRVNSERGIQFRQWATEILRQYIYKGYVLDGDRFKYGSKFSTRFFDDLLEEIRDIRSSERMLYQKITDIYATSIDYSPKEQVTKTFFATVQNKLHFAITGHTAAEVISERADSRKAHMGLTTWRRAPRGKIMPSDVVIAKNYLNKEEMDHLNRIVTMYLDYAELQAVKQRPMYMKDWGEKLTAFLKFNEHEILNDAGRVRHEVALALALDEYEKYRVIQDRTFQSDFDKLVKLSQCKNKDMGDEK
ncbi:MAG: virulence RhuM family protein [Holosporaceae bacterium]|jgi:hypothetical protein|nr:virulence RhuM family protein [Holosporaceae bacterium]